MQATGTVGVALGSGGAAGLAYIGVLEELVAAGVPVACVAGTSAGALVGAAFAAGQLAGLRAAMLALTRARVFALFDPTWPRSGLFEGRRALELVRPHLGERIEALPCRFAAVATDLFTGEEVLLDRGPVVEAVRASIAVPGILTPVRVGGRWLVDGGLANPVPVSAVRALGADFVIAVSIHRVPQVAAIAVAGASRAVQGPPPAELGIADILARSSAAVQARIAAARFREHPPDVLVLPETDAGLFEFYRAAEIIEAGRRAGRAALPEIRAALARHAAESERRAQGERGLWARLSQTPLLGGWGNRFAAAHGSPRPGLWERLGRGSGESWLARLQGRMRSSAAPWAQPALQRTPRTAATERIEGRA